MTTHKWHLPDTNGTFFSPSPPTNAPQSQNARQSPYVSRPNTPPPNASQHIHGNNNGTDVDTKLEEMQSLLVRMNNTLEKCSSKIDTLSKSNDSFDH